MKAFTSYLQGLMYLLGAEMHHHFTVVDFEAGDTRYTARLTALLQEHKASITPEVASALAGFSMGDPCVFVSNVESAGENMGYIVSYYGLDGEIICVAAIPN